MTSRQGPGIALWRSLVRRPALGPATPTAASIDDCASSKIQPRELVQRRIGSSRPRRVSIRMGARNPFFTPACAHVPVDLRSVERILRRAENSPRSEHGEVGHPSPTNRGANRCGDSIQFLTVMAASAAPAPRSRWTVKSKEAPDLPPRSRACRLDGTGDQPVLLTEGSRQWRGRGTPEVATYDGCRVVGRDLPPRHSATAPRFGSHCARGTRASACAAVTRARGAL